MRRLTCYSVSGGKNSLRYLYKTVSLWRTIINFIIISLGRVSPSFEFKNWLYRLMGMKIGKNVSLGLMVMIDVFFPEEIEVGDNTIVGYNTTLLAHEYLVPEWRKGKVKIGKNVLIGANSTILAGIEIGDNAVISACSLVNKDVSPGSFVGGVPVRPIIKEEVHEING